MTTFWIVTGVLVVAVLAAMLVHDRRARARGARLAPDAGARSGVRGTGVTGNPEAYRSSPGSHPTGWGMGSGN